jgi:hypothetical protein
MKEASAHCKVSARFDSSPQFVILGRMDSTLRLKNETEKRNRDRFKNETGTGPKNETGTGPDMLLRSDTPNREQTDWLVTSGDVTETVLGPAPFPYLLYAQRWARFRRFLSNRNFEIADNDELADQTLVLSHLSFFLSCKCRYLIWLLKKGSSAKISRKFAKERNG